LTDKEIRERITTLIEEIANKETRLEKLKEGAANVTPEEKAKAEARYLSYRSLWRTRKRMCSEVLNALLENANMKPQELRETIGIETDEDVGVELGTDVVKPDTRPAKRQKV